MAIAGKVFTIGHSTRSLEEFIEILKSFKIARLVDIRTITRSRHNPQFNQENFPSALRDAGIAYEHVQGLGGFRRAKPFSVNAAWRNASFRGFADYMQTSEFKKSLDSLVGSIGKERLALMCAEAVPWRCHRSLIADALLSRGINVRHILGPGQTRLHKLTPFARVEGDTVIYPEVN